MNETRIENNKVTLSGEIVSNFEFSHEILGEGFYTAMLASKRKSTAKDIIPITASERIIGSKEDWKGRFVRASGRFQSYNKHEGDRNQLMLSAFLGRIEETGEIPFDDGKNHISLDGFICKPPIYRKTPAGREITDIFLAVNRYRRKSDYIPCIAWGRNARFASGLEAGTRLQIEGRIQSREYQKRISDDEFETKVAYEVSVGKLTLIEET